MIKGALEAQVPSLRISDTISKQNILESMIVKDCLRNHPIKIQLATVVSRLPPYKVLLILSFLKNFVCGTIFCVF